MTMHNDDRTVLSVVLWVIVVALLLLAVVISVFRIMDRLTVDAQKRVARQRSEAPLPGFRKLQFEGHDYIVFPNNTLHDPSCRACNIRKETKWEKDR